MTVLSLDSENPWNRCRQLAPAAECHGRTGPEAVPGHTWAPAGPRLPGSGRPPGPRQLVGGGGCAQGIFGDPGAGWVGAGEVLDVTVAVHLQSHNGLLYGLLVAACGGQEVLWKQEVQTTGVSFAG